VPISIVERNDATCTISMNAAITGTIAARWWIAATIAPELARQARLCAGDEPDLGRCREAVARSAGLLRAVLTVDETAINRASAACTRLDSMFDGMRKSGALREFNAEYKIRRAATIAEGKGYMPHHVALKRLKAALVPHLMQQSGKPMSSILQQVFR
jgi:hypothetical protein